MPGKRTSTQVSSLTNNVGTYEYKYDTKGNITKIRDSSGTLIADYEYDEAGQLVRENDTQFVYDKGGNIVSKGDMEFVYDQTWTDKLVKVSDNSIEYDSIGNPTKIGVKDANGDWEDGTVELVWQGRRLMSYGSNTYTYNEDGLRTSKTVGGVRNRVLLERQHADWAENWF